MANLNTETTICSEKTDDPTSVKDGERGIKKKSTQINSCYQPIPNPSSSSSSLKNSSLKKNSRNQASLPCKPSQPFSYTKHPPPLPPRISHDQPPLPPRISHDQPPLPHRISHDQPPLPPRISHDQPPLPPRISQDKPLLPSRTSHQHNPYYQPDVPPRTSNQYYFENPTPKTLLLLPSSNTRSTQPPTNSSYHPSLHNINSNTSNPPLPPRNSHHQPISNNQSICVNSTPSNYSWNQQQQQTLSSSRHNFTNSLHPPLPPLPSKCENQSENQIHLGNECSHHCCHQYSNTHHSSQCHQITYLDKEICIVISDPKVKICPRPYCGNHLKRNQNSKVHCSKCQETFCFDCMSDFHEGITCEEAKCDDNNKSIKKYENPENLNHNINNYRSSSSSKRQS